MKDKMILVLNCGSSSLKFTLIEPNSKARLLSGIAEQLGNNNAKINIHYQTEHIVTELAPPYDHQVAISQLVTFLKQHDLTESVVAIGHRVVHGGEYYANPVIINEQVKTTVKELSELAPLHNPANLLGIQAATANFPELPQVAVFDTAFHQTMPKMQFLYPLPYDLYQTKQIRKYGFHGTSHYFVAKQAAQFLQQKFEQTNVITAHLGNGCSVTAVKNGESVDSSMGFTPLEGVMMGTRSGSIDPGIIFHLQQHLGYSCEQVNQLMNKQSGLLGVSGISNDCRALEQQMQQGNEMATLALTMFCHRIAKEVAALSVNLPNIDALVFTGGIGENSSFVRATVCQYLSLLNFNIDNKLNQGCDEPCFNIAAKNSRPILVINTDEEGVIATQTAQLVFGDQ